MEKERKDNKGFYDSHTKDARILLNLGAGKIIPTELIENKDPYILINVDKNYLSETPPDRIENFCSYVQRYGIAPYENTQQSLYSKCDMFKFLQRSKIIFDEIYLCRILEHIPRTSILHFIYLLSTSIKKGGSVKVIVPNYESLAKRILKEQVTSIGFDKENIITTTELLNEPDDPHASIWTSQRAKYFFEYESRFKVKINSEHFSFDGRDIYLNFEAILI